MNADPIHSVKRQVNLMRLEGELAACRTWLTARPIELALEISNVSPLGCNQFREAYTVGRKASEGGHLSLDIVEHLKPYMDTFVRIMLVGEGDPMAHPHFAKILDFCLAGGAEVSFATNGDRLTPDLIRRLVEGKLTHIRFCMDWAGQVDWAGQMDWAGQGAFCANRSGGRQGVVLDNLQALVKARAETNGSKPFIEVEAVLMRRNVEALPLLLERLASLSADRVMLKPLDILDTEPQAREFFRHESLNLDALLEAAEKARKTAKAHGIELFCPTIDALAGLGPEGARTWNVRLKPPPTRELYARYGEVDVPAEAAGETQKNLEVRPGKTMDPVTCTDPWTTLYIQWNGEVLPCRKNRQSIARCHPWTRPEEIWNGPAYRSLRKALASKDQPARCRPCIEGLEGRDVLEEYSRVVLPMESSPEPAPEANALKEPDPAAVVLGLGFSMYGTSAALAGGGITLISCPLERLTGVTPSRFISRLAPASVRGEFYLEDGIFHALVKSALEGPGRPWPDKMRYLAYNPDPAFIAHLPGGRNPALENLFPEAIPLLVDHHLGHMALAYFTSPFKEAALLVADDAVLAAARDCPVITLGRGSGKDLQVLERIVHPHNPGALYLAAGRYLGLDADAEDRLTGMAQTGSNRLDPEFLKEIELIDGKGFLFRKRGFLADLAEKSCSGGLGQDPVELLEDLFGPRRIQGAPPSPHHFDVAHAVHKSLCDIMVHLARSVHTATDLPDLCLSGCTGTGKSLQARILAETPIERLHVPLRIAGPGLAAGNALYASIVRLGGPKPEGAALRRALQAAGEGPDPEGVERFRKIALATLRHQHERLVWAWNAEKGNVLPPNAASAVELLARQNERLLGQRLAQSRVLDALQEKMVALSGFKGIRTILRDKLKGIKKKFGKK